MERTNVYRILVGGGGGGGGTTFFLGSEWADIIKMNLKYTELERVQ
jgi:hypothetical protein